MIISPGMQVCNAKDPPLNREGFPATGTIGGVVYASGKKLLLTCYHCVHNPELNWNDYKADRVNDSVQTIVDGSFIRFGKIVAAIGDDRVDAALIEPLKSVQISASIPLLGIPSDKLPAENQDAGLIVRKYGNKTKKTTGTFTGPQDSIGLIYFPELKKHFFTNLLQIQPD